MLAHVMLPYFVSSKFCVINFGETTTYRKTMAELYNDAFQDAGWIMHSRRIWKKDFASTSLGPSDINLSVPVAEWEYLWSFRKPPSKKEVFRNRNLTRRGVWDSTGYKKVSGTHPAAFPIWLPLTCMDAWTGINELVVDPFLGSGTTMEACYQAGRRCVGIEQSEEYAEKAAKRMETIVNQQRLFEPRVLKSDKPKQHRLTV